MIPDKFFCWEAAISLASVGIKISMSELYEGLVFPEDDEIPAP